MLRRLLIFLFSFFLLILVVLAIGGAYLALKDPSPGFFGRKGKFVDATVTPAGGDALTTKSWLTVRSDNGFMAECGLLVPRKQGVRHPAIVLLGGKATGRYAVDYALGIDNVIIVAVDYPYAPRETYSVWDVISDVPVIRRAFFDMPPAVMLVMDYLATRPDVDTSRIVLLGYSFGAPFVPVIMANDRRPAVAAIVYGGGDVREMIRHNVRRYESAAFSQFVAAIAGVLLYPLEPMRYVEKIAPTPLIMINGTEDEQVPPANAKLLYNAAKEPKHITWLESRHVNPRNPELTRHIIGTLEQELVRAGVVTAASPTDSNYFPTPGR